MKHSVLCLAGVLALWAGLVNGMPVQNDETVPVKVQLTIQGVEKQEDSDIALRLLAIKVPANYSGKMSDWFATGFLMKGQKYAHPFFYLTKAKEKAEMFEDQISALISKREDRKTCIQIEAELKTLETALPDVGDWVHLGYQNHRYQSDSLIYDIINVKDCSAASK